MAFDDLDDEGPSNDSIDDSESTQTAAAPAADLPQLPEDRQIALPSNSGLGDPGYCEIELGLRVTQADKSLQALRDAIADKSFQYSHVIRVAPRKNVNTRARANIAKLNNTIAYHARVYRRCRQAMTSLNADDITLGKYQTLSRDDLRSSAALLNPNEPGSTRVQLSWIWQTAERGSHQSPNALRECELNVSFKCWTATNGKSQPRTLDSCPCAAESMAGGSHLDPLRNAVDSPIFPKSGM